jgi:hypothetical protein
MAGTMSIAVALQDLRDEIIKRGDAAFAVTVGDGGPHVVSLRVRWDGDVLVGGAGNRTAANVAGNRSVSSTAAAPSPTASCGSHRRRPSSTAQQRRRGTARRA